MTEGFPVLRIGVMCAGVLVAASVGASDEPGSNVVAMEPAAAGFWVTQDKSSVVRIFGCDAGLCGSIVGLRKDHLPGDRPTDTRNPDPSRRGDPMCGLTMMGSLKPKPGSASKWGDGWIYDPESGRTYSAEMQLDGADRLKLRGYLGIALFGRSEIWTRESPDAAPPNRCKASTDS